MKPHRLYLTSLSMALAPMPSAAFAALDVGPKFEPDDCIDCEHKDESDSGHCFMFKTPPSVRCGQRKPKLKLGERQAREGL